MNSQIENSISRIAEQARGRYNDLLAAARQQTVDAAGVVTRGKAPVKTVSKLGLKLTAVSHRTADKVLKQQTKVVENQLDAMAGRLQAAATATGIRDLVGTQVRLIPENASRIVADTRDTFGILAGAGQEVGKLVKSTVAELRGVRQPVATAKKAAKKTAKKAGKKKAPVKKSAAKTPVTTREKQAA